MGPAKKILGLVGALAALTALWSGVSYYEDNLKVEHLSFEVVGKIENGQKSLKGHHQEFAELRQYPKYLVAQVTYENIDMEPAMNKAFHDLAGFIFGDNTAVDGSGSVKIPMTSPVITEQIGERKYKVSFVMPHHYTAETLPVPNNDQISILYVEPQEMAAVSWKGAVPSEKHVAEKTAELESIIDHNSFDHVGNAMLFEYDPPFTPSWMRNNEVLYKVEKK